MRSRKRMMLILCAGLASLMLAACGGPGGDPGESAAAETGQISGSETAEAENTPDTETEETPGPEEEQMPEADEEMTSDPGTEEISGSEEAQASDKEETPEPLTEEMEKLVGEYILDDVISEGGESHKDYIASLSQQGKGCTLTLKDDRTGVLVLFDQKMGLTWDEEEIVTVDSVFPYHFEDRQLTLTDRDSSLIFVPADSEE